ncbi:hypothetical protein BDP27DRAFT_1317911 [Rhodocollybia butyracea]|uniref:Uncharacterized protein n=1 Tax=Rhodocollybia butyracea TaxID=206335 RepID=A0A9P5PWZ8_9AGAR|nr:hypothetical protein BDP27DRAFT_1317911 [Rhodocollybia butyracea]
MFKLVALSFFLLGVSGNPVRRDSCNPNAQGAPVSIRSPEFGLEWTVESGVGPNWFINQSGDFPTSYIITSTDVDTMAATITGVHLFDNNQVFDIACDVCNTDASPGNNIGEGCVISPVNVTDACIIIDASAGDALRNFGCATIEPSDLWDITT